MAGLITHPMLTRTPADAARRRELPGPRPAGNPPNSEYPELPWILTVKPISPPSMPP